MHIKRIYKTSIQSQGARTAQSTAGTKIPSQIPEQAEAVMTLGSIKSKQQTDGHYPESQFEIMEIKNF